MKRFLGLTVALNAMLPVGFGATAPRYENFGTVTTLSTPPQIDATAFINHGVFTVQTPLPFDTQNTLYWTNRGQMFGSVGFRFDTVNGTNGLRRPSASFYNRGQIDADESILGFGQLETILQAGFVAGSYIDIAATNIQHSGVMRVGPLGLIKMQGSSVQLERSGLVAGIAALSDLGSPYTTFLGDTEYLNPGGINEIYWGAGINGRMDPQNQNGFNLALGNVITPNSGPHEVAYPSQFTNIVSIPSPFFLTFAGYSAYAYTNAVTETNWVTQVVFAPTNYPTGVGVEVRFAPSTVQPIIPGTQTAMVQYSLPDIDAVTGLPFTNRLFILDSLAGRTNAYLLTNAAVNIMQRPSSLDFATAEPPEWGDGAPGNTVFAPELINHPESMSPVVTNYYAAARVGIGTVSRVITTPGGSGLFPNLQRFLNSEDNATFGGSSAGYLSDPTNNPARIELNADSLDLYLTRLKSDGMMSLNATHFTGRSPARTDAPLFRFNLGSTNGSVVVSNVVPTSVRRLSGDLACWSGVWTNMIPLVVPDPADPALQVTNTVEIRTHVLIVDTSGLYPVQPVETMDAEFHSTHVQYHDIARITRKLMIDAESFHNLGTIDVLRPRFIDGSEFPRLRFLTNEGTITAIDYLQLGTDRPATNRIELLSNSGEMSAANLRLWSRALMNTGVLAATESIMEIQADDVKLDGGSMVAGSDVVLRAKDLKAEASYIQSGTIVTNPSTGVVTWYHGTLFLDVADRLTDGGPAMAPNEWICHDGFQLLTKPATGDLLATTLRTAANIYGDAVHLWAAEDRGPGATGYQDNAAVGRLILDGRFQSLFTFGPTDPSRPSAIYVNYLELLGDATNVAASLNIRPNFKIYYLDSNVAADQLDGLFDGAVVRVTGVDVGTPPPSSLGGDGEGEGGVQVGFVPGVTGEAGAAAPAALSWIDYPGGTYSVEYTTNLVEGPWIPLGQTSNGATRRAQMTLPADLAPGATQVFFRVVATTP